ncbi:alpha/beta hydrolase [Corynebacterium sp. YIM 101645]|uniref:Alpha/beta hydrolase n=1 Tax=Corynebacterium lemuris TaxID=1859292 RepID=A0ABT2G372_9CORY|nr:alpha/beta hydrolase [Corynebacterium lemuris]MCS5480727.1 alpha/beta hydrolase [Corynebacterium lemuris]
MHLRHGTITTSDGTELAYSRAGEGPAIVFVHGSVSTRHPWFPVIEALADNFTCLIHDRRGRGDTRESDASVASYGPETELTDIATMLELAGPGAHLFGHSYGAVCALEFALRNELPGHLIAFEPPLPVSGPVAGDTLPRYRQAIAEGDPDAALTLALREIVRSPESAIGGLRNSPAWPALTALTPTWTRELEAIDSLGADAGSIDRFRALSGRPVDILLGTATTQPHIDAAQRLHETIRGSRLQEMDGLDHFGHVAAPAVVARHIREALTQAPVQG